MHNRWNVEKSYGLEHALSESLEKMRDNVTRSHNLKKQIVKLRRARQQAIELPASADEMEEGRDDETED